MKTSHRRLSYITNTKWSQRVPMMISHIQQQPLELDDLTGVLALILTLDRWSAEDDADGPMRRLISAAIVRNACSTFVAFFALVSRNGMFSPSTNSCTIDQLACNTQ